MDETVLLDDWSVKLDLDNWWKELLGQSVDSPETFDFEQAKNHVPWSEFNASQAIYSKIGYHLSFIEATKTWYAWDGRIHAPCDGEALAYKIGKAYFEALRRALSEVEALVNSRKHSLELLNADEKDIKQIADIYSKGFRRQRDYRDRISSDAGLASLVRMMRSDFSVPRDYYESDQQFLVVKNCVFDLDEMRKGALVHPMHHDPSRPVTKYLDVIYDSSVDYSVSRWWSYLQSSVKDGDIPTLVHIQKVVGAAFMGQRKLRTLINLKGPPSSGKSIFIETLWKMGKEGAGYCAMPDSRAITKVQGQNFEQDNFRGRRVIGISEPSSKEDIDDDFLKRYTGDEWMETRTLHAKSSGWAPQGVIFVSSNATLKINSRDQAIVDRVQVIDFPYEFVEGADPNNPTQKERDNSLSDTLNLPEERSAILNWILYGMKWYVKGHDDSDANSMVNSYITKPMSLKPPASVEQNKTALVSNASSALRWLYEMIEEGDIVFVKDRQSNSHLQVAEAFSRYTIWCALNGERRGLSRRFFEEDIDHRYSVIRAGGNKCFEGLGYSNAYYAKIDNQTYTYNPSIQQASPVDSNF